MTTADDSKLVRRKKAFDLLTSRSIHPMDMASSLKDDGIISVADLQAIKSADDKQLELFKLIEQANKYEKISLMDYEWQMLPTQRVKLTIVSSSGVREFIYESP